MVIPVFILDPKLLALPNTGQNRIAFLFEGLRKLDSDLQKIGSTLIVREGDPLKELCGLCRETGAKRIFAEADVSPYARRRDERVKCELSLTLTQGITVHPTEKLVKSDGTPYTVFTPFSRMWHSLPFPGRPIPTPERLPTPPPLTSLGLPDLAASCSLEYLPRR